MFDRSQEPADLSSYGLFIDGAEQDCVSGHTLEGINPHSGRACAPVTSGGEVDIGRDARAARLAFDRRLRTACLEVTRLARQATFVRDLTEDVLRRAGVERGMCVLDLGCGVGDASLLLAKLVGPSGLVVGVDPEAAAIREAEKSATAAGRCYWTRFVAADLDTFVPDKPFDAVVARLILAQAPERAAGLRLLSHQVRPHQVRPFGNRAPNDASRAASPICPIPSPRSRSFSAHARAMDSVGQSRPRPTRSQTMAIRKNVGTALGLLVVMANSSAGSADLKISKAGPDLSASLQLVPTDHPPERCWRDNRARLYQPLGEENHHGLEDQEHQPRRDTQP